MLECREKIHEVYDFLEQVWFYRNANARSFSFSSDFVREVHTRAIVEQRLQSRAQFTAVDREKFSKPRKICYFQVTFKAECLRYYPYAVWKFQRRE